MTMFITRINLYGSELLVTEKDPGPHAGLIRASLLEEPNVVNALVDCGPEVVEIDLKLCADDLCEASSRAWELAGKVVSTMKWSELVTSVNSLALIA